MTSELPYSGCDALVQALKDEGVDLLFGYPGGAVIPEFDALYREHFPVALVRCGTNKGLRMPPKVMPNQPVKPG